MPYHIESSGPGKFEILDDKGKIVGTHPTRKQALGQLKALYANVPEAKEDSMDTEEKASKDPGDYLIVEDREAPTTWHLQVKKNGTPDHGLMGAAWAALHEGYRGNAYEGPDKGKALDKLKALYAAEKMDTPATKEAQEEAPQPSLIDRVIAAIKGEAAGHPFRGNQFGGSGGAAEGESSGGSSGYRKPEDFKGAANSKVAKTLSEADKHLQKAKSDAAEIPEGKRRDFNYIQSQNSARDAEAVISGATHTTRMGAQGVQQAQADKALQWAKESSRLLGYVAKEGKRNSSPDGDRLQQIHDLAVLNGASCPMVMKEADGKLRWVLLSSNAFQDSDKEIISQKALENDVARTDKEQAPYGPLRWWHMGAPDPIGLHAGSGADIGDCDYRAMSGRVLIESGTFRNERIGEAIKERADTLAGSIGFFHPKSEPDSEGVYQNIVQFERSLLPRGKASNMLTALTVKGWEDMATSKEKQDALAALLGDPSLAESVIKQAEKTEKDADQRGLKYKEVEATEKTMTGTPTAVPATGANGINPIGLEKDKQKKGAEGSPEEEATEPKKEAEAEPDYEKMMKGLTPHIAKLIEEKMKAGAKEAAEKSAGIQATIDQIAADVKELKGDLPRGIRGGGFRASVSEATILPGMNQKSADPTTQLDSIIDGWINAGKQH